ncbi:hypothetical protein PV326_014077 [Microctonus aethiopoides]|nr:hypothetical protein PV326_014077 [Microctonus aethiopoides]
MGYEPLSYEDYIYPEWANIIGWLITLSSIAMIPGVAIYKLIVTPGRFSQRIKFLTTPWRDSQQYCNNTRLMMSSVANGAIRTSLIEEGEFDKTKDSLEMTEEQTQVLFNDSQYDDPPPEAV